MQPHAPPLPAAELEAVTRVDVLAVRTAGTGNGAALLPRLGVFRVLVCRPTHSLGNTLLLTPLLREIEAIYPGAEIDIVSRTPIALELFGRFASVRRIFLLPSRPVQRLPRLINILFRIRETRYDLVIDPSPRSRSGRALLALARGRYKLGFHSRRGGGLTHPVSLPSLVRHSGQVPVALLRAAVAASSGSFPLLDIGLSPAERDLGRIMLSRLLDSCGSQAGHGVIGVFANATGDKLLPQAWWLAFLETLTARFPQHRVVEIVPAFGRSMLGSRYPTYYSSDVRRLASLLSALSLFVSADCGIMHLACAAGVPVTGVFSATKAEEWGPYGPRDRALDARDMPAAQLASLIEMPMC